MNEKHLLFWLFDYLVENHPAVYYDLKDNLKGNADNVWVNDAIKERMTAYKTAVDKL